MMGCLSSVPVLAQGDWQHGIGTGIYLLNIEGDTGADTALGSVLVKTDLDNEEVSDLIESAIGLGGFSTNGTWTILYNAGQLEMAGSGSGSDLLGTPASGSGSLTATSAELAAVYNFAVTGGHYWGALLGVRYTEHEYEVDLTIGASPTTLGLTESWTDAIVGLTHTYPISEKWTWNNTANIGFGSGTDGTYYIKTGLTRQFAENWSSTFYGQLLHYDYENGTRGDADWYLYDTDEYGLGVTILYHY
jgi:hypothetical protein